MGSRGRWLSFTFVLLLAATAAIAWRGNQASDSSPKVTPPLEFTAADLTTLVARRLDIELTFPGDVQALSQATVRSKLSAEVQRVLVREGEHVTAGQLLAEFDTSTLRAARAERLAALDAARAQLAQSERTREVNVELLKRNFISKNLADSSGDAHRAQEAAVAVAQAQLTQVQLQLADARVHAPIAGQISRRFVQPGEKASFDMPLFALIDLTELEVKTSIPVSDAAAITPGMVANIDIEGLPERSFAGRVERINPAAEQGSRTLHAFVRLRNERVGRDWLLKAGMFARVHLHIGADRERPSLPLTALRSDEGAASVWVLADGHLKRRTVVPGRRDERAQMVEIASGLATTDQVLASKFDNLRDGMTARIVAAPAAK